MPFGPAYLNRPVSIVGDSDSHTLSAAVDLNRSMSLADYHLASQDLFFFYVGPECIKFRNRQEARVESKVEVAIFAANRFMDSDEEGAVWESAFDHDFVELAGDGGHALASAEDGLSQGHELGDAVVPISNKLLEDLIFRSSCSDVERWYADAPTAASSAVASVRFNFFPRASLFWARAPTAWRRSFCSSRGRRCMLSANCQID